MGLFNRSSDGEGADKPGFWEGIDEKLSQAREWEQKKSVSEEKEEVPEKGEPVFKGKPFLSAVEFIARIEKDSDYKLYNKTKFGSAKRKELVEKLLLKEFGSGIDLRDLNIAKSQLALGSQGKYKNLLQKEREDLLKLLNAILGE